MPGVALHPNTPVPGLGGLPAARKSMPPPSTHPNTRPTSVPAAQSGASRHHDDLSVQEIKNMAKDSVNREARGASAITLIRSAQTQFIHAKDCEARGDLRSAYANYIKAASLAKMTMDSAEYTQEKKGKGGVLRKEVNDFLYGDGRELPALSAAVEEKLKAIEKSHPANGSDSTDASNSKPGPSIAERMRALQDNGLSIEPTKRISRDISNLPTPPLSPSRFPSSSSSAQPQLPSITTVFPTPPPAAPSSSVYVPTSAFGPPSPQSSPSSSPQMNSFDMSGFTQAFPSIDELEENSALQLPSVPTGVSVASNRSNRSNASTTKDFRNGDSSAASPITSFRNFAVPIERPSSTPITPVNNTFASRPASPTKPSPIKPSGLSASTSASRPPIPVRNAATPKELLSYINDWKVLLIDVRERGEFEREHIKIDSVVCIEPNVLRRSNVTSAMLEDSMSIAPLHEGALFSNRDKFDLVAVYDSSSTSFGSPDSLLSILVRVISEQAFKKMLKHMPMMLIGGLEAWKRDVGSSHVWRSESAHPEVHRPTPTAPHSGSIGSPSFTSSGVNGHYTNGGYSSATTENNQTWTPRVNGDIGHRPAYSLDHTAGHSRSPADVTYTGNYSAGERPPSRRPALSRPASGSLSQSRSMDNVPPPLPLSAAPSTNGFSPPISYPQFPRRISPTTSGSASASITSSGIPPTPFTSAPISYDITSPPQASINPSGLSRRRSDFVDQSQEALLSLNNTPRAPIDYPELSIRPPPAVASPVLERQDNRRALPSAVNTGPRPPKIGSDYPVTYWSDMQIGTSGLKNLGNTCYMNAPIQCLSATVPFARFFTEGRWRQAVNCVNPLGSKGLLAGSFAKLVHEMWGGDMPYLVPTDFRKTVCKLSSQYEGSEQHDSQEFLSFLIDGIHEDLNRIILRPKIIPTPEQEAELETLPQQIASDREWRTWRAMNDSLIVDYFQGQFRNRLECLTCHTASTTYNVFSILQLPIPNTSNGRISIDKCLDTLLNEEILERDDAWDCPKCKTKRSAKKRLSLARLPPVLLIHFKRFKYKGAFVDKVDTFVEFPMKSLDLTNYMPAPLPPGADKSQLNGGLPMSPDDPRTQLPPYRYDLYGVTNHYGKLSSGHYTAFIASRGGWMYCDDSSVQPADVKSVVNQKAYVLFYKRVRQ